MRTIAGVTILLLVLSPSWHGTAQQPTQGYASVDEVLQAVRADLQEKRSDVLAKNLVLTSEQAGKFWPVYDRYQKEQDAIMDQQLRGIQTFVESFDRMSDADALALMETHLRRDSEMSALRQRWLPEFQRVLPTKLAVRAMQIDRPLSLMHQTEFATRIPLAH